MRRLHTKSRVVLVFQKICPKGPAGLFFAACVKRMNPDCRIRIIDKAAGVSKYSKAMALTPRTMECMSYLGAEFLEELLSRGLKCDGPCLKWSSTGKTLFQPDLGVWRSPYPFMLLLGQYDTEVSLESACEALGLKVERNTELMHMEQNSNDKITVQLKRTTTGVSTTTSCCYLIGCDGAYSFVRQALNLPFVVVTRSETFLMAAATLKPDTAPYMEPSKPPILKRMFGLSFSLLSSLVLPSQVKPLMEYGLMKMTL